MTDKYSTVRVAALLGPTAVGKSRVALSIARELRAEIISIDSMQVYRGMDIGTSKTEKRLRRCVPHHMLDIINPAELFSVAEFQEKARGVVEDVHRGGKLPLLVGGSGLYFEAVVFDMLFPPGSKDDNLRRDLEKWAAEDPRGIRERLLEVDPGFARREDHSNMRRVVRALEVYERTGKPISDFQKKRKEHPLYYGYRGAVLNAPRRLLYQAIDARVDTMLEAGLIDEVKSLAMERGFSRTARQALGYKEVLDYLEGAISLEEAICDIKKRSRRYAKRQMTWFRRIPGLRWFDIQGDDLREGLPAVSATVRDYLAEGV